MKKELRTCQDSPTGEHSYEPDIEYDMTGETISCVFCGSLEGEPELEKVIVNAWRMSKTGRTIQ